MTPAPNIHAFLRSRGWRLDTEWRKRGWSYRYALDARAVEEYFERTDGALPLRKLAAPEQLRQAREAVDAARGEKVRF